MWPLTAYAVNPLVVPALLMFVGATALVLVRPEYGIALALALSPLTNLTMGAGDEGEFKPFQLLLPALAVGLLIYGAIVTRSTAEIRRTPWLAAAVALFIVVAVAASLRAIDPGESVKKVVILLTAAAFFFTVLQVCRERKQLVVVAVGAVAGLLIAALQGIAQQYLGQFSEHGFVIDGEIVKRVQGSFGHPNQYGGYLAVLIPVAAALLLGKSFPASVRWFGGISLAAAVPALMFSYVRGAIVALVVGSLVWLAILRPRLAALVAVAVALVAITIAPGTLQERFTSSTTSGGDVTLREDLWRSALDIYGRHPVLGAGVNNFAEAYAQLPAVLPNASQRRLLHNTQVLIPPHAANLYLNILAEMGTIGMLAFLFVAFSALATAYRGSHAHDPFARHLCLAIGAGITIMAAHSMFEVTLLTELAMPLFALLGVAAVFVSLDAQVAPEPETASPDA